MESGGHEFRARCGVHVWAALVLVQIITDSDAERRCDRLPPAGMDVFDGGYGCAQRFLRNKCRVATFWNFKTWIPSGAPGIQATVWKCLLRRGHGKLRGGGSDREIRVANLWRWMEIPDYPSARLNGVCRLSEAHTKPDRHELRIELWNPFLKSSGN